VLEGGGEGVEVGGGIEYGWPGREAPGVLMSHGGYWL